MGVKTKKEVEAEYLKQAAESQKRLADKYGVAACIKPPKYQARVQRKI